ncbi:MAG: hypothetical protein GF383_05380 [Candidatus Lokiarchaeota archaeon]|nr:hypothetical protein [Candidatus Lokiarchaeota archaeon]MBD3339328.1 hypothetical protein [Candidatus Lokiarchaeota archaeon]
MSLEKSKVKKVYDVIKEYVKRKSFSSLPDVINHVGNHLGKDSDLTNDGIEKIIKSLLREKHFMLGTKLTREDILKTDSRERVYSYIKSNPGANINELMSENNLGGKQVLWHLKFLRKYDFIREKKYGNQKAYYNVELDSENDDLLFYFRNEKVLKIVDLLKREKNGLVATNISEYLDMHYKTVKKYLKILLELKIITLNKDQNKKLYSLDEKSYEQALSLVLKIVNKNK